MQQKLRFIPVHAETQLGSRVDEVRGLRLGDEAQVFPAPGLEPPRCVVRVGHARGQDAVEVLGSDEEDAKRHQVP